MRFLSGLGKGLHRAFDGTNLAIAQALFAGDHQGAAALRARQDELQRQREEEREQGDARDAQVIGARNVGNGQAGREWGDAPSIVRPVFRSGSGQPAGAGMA